MIKEWVSDQSLLLAPAFAMVLFLVLFVVVLVWIYRPGSRRIYEREAQLPFDEGRRAGGRHDTASPVRED
jgi:cbb3-type cytochrome oxidase subunit 3